MIPDKKSQEDKTFENKKWLEMPATIDINPEGDHPLTSVIWLHGLGADAGDFVPIVEQLNLTPKNKTRFVFPNAPIRSVTVNGGMMMRAWYDIMDLNLAAREDIVGVKESTSLLELLIEREQQLGIPTHRIILAGFSQGGAMSLYCGLRYKERLGGIIALSGYIPDAAKLSTEVQSANAKIPVFLAHGMFDPIVPLLLGQMTRDQLEGLGIPVEWHSYPMPHSVIPEEIEDIGKFINRVFDM